jgi:hypothetical protein
MGDGIGAFGFWLAVGAGSAGLLFGPIGRALARTVELSVEAVLGRLFGHTRDDRGTEQVEQLSQRMAELQGLEHRVLELEERLDFAERLLTSGRPGSGPEVDTPPEALPAAGTR